MEEAKSSEINNPANAYLNRLAFFGGSAALASGLISAILLMKFRRGFIFGLGLGAGYCHNDFSNILKSMKQ